MMGLSSDSGDVYGGYCPTGPVRDIHRKTFPYVWEHNETETCLLLFRDERAVETHHTFLGYYTNRTGMDVETSVLNVALSGSWVCPIV